MKKANIQLTDEVIDAINGELAYTETLQDQGRADNNNYGTEGQLVTLKVYTDEALVAWTKNASDEQARDALRKVAAIAIRALVMNGCPRREGF